MQSNGPIKTLRYPSHNVGHLEPRPVTGRRLNIERFCWGQFAPSALYFSKAALADAPAAARTAATGTGRGSSIPLTNDGMYYLKNSASHIQNF